MNTKEIVEQTGVTMGNVYACYERDIERFAEIVRQDEANGMRETYMKMIRGAVLEEREACAKSCEEWGMKKVNDWAHDEEMCEDAKARAWDAMQCAATIRARGNHEQD